MLEMLVRDLVRKYFFNIEGLFITHDLTPEKIRVYVCKSKETGFLWVFGAWDTENPTKETQNVLSHNEVICEFAVKPEPDLVTAITNKILSLCKDKTDA